MNSGAAKPSKPPAGSARMASRLSIDPPWPDVGDPER